MLSGVRLLLALVFFFFFFFFFVELYIIHSG